MSPFESSGTTRTSSPCRAGHSPKLLLAFSSLLYSLEGMTAAPGYIIDTRPVKPSVEDYTGSMADGAEPDDDEPDTSGARDFSSLWEDASITLKPRTYYFDRRREGPDSTAWAGGGAITADTGWWQQRVRFGATVYTSQKLYGPSDQEGTLLLQDGQNGYTTLGQAYLQTQLTESIKVRAGRMSFDLPYVNGNDARMVPNTFEAVRLVGKPASDFTYVVSHLTQMKRRTKTKFDPMSRAAGFSDTDEPLTLAGALYEPGDSFNIGAITQYSWEFMNTLYAETNLTLKQSELSALRLSAQYTDQRSVGDEIAGNFSTWVWGGKAAYSYRHATLSLAFSRASADQTILSPYGGYPGYLSLMVKDFFRADEEAWLVGLSYDFGRWGLNGLSAFTNYAKGDTPESGDNASPDQREWDFTVDYRWQNPLLKGLWLRLRYADVSQRGDNAISTNETRAILNYQIPLL